MGRQSTMENKTPYQVKREDKKWSREYAARELMTITEDRLSHRTWKTCVSLRNCRNGRSVWGPRTLQLLLCSKMQDW